MCDGRTLDGRQLPDQDLSAGLDQGLDGGPRRGDRVRRGALIDEGGSSGMDDKEPLL